MITSKHLATFLIGAAAGAAIVKYNSMSEEEKEKLVNDLKDKADKVKGEAEVAVSKFSEYFDVLKEKGMDALKDKVGEAEKMVADFLKQNQAPPTEPNKA